MYTFITFIIALSCIVQIPCYIINNNINEVKSWSLNSNSGFSNRYKSELLQTLSDRDVLDKLTDENVIDNLLLKYNRKESPLSVYLGIDITSSKAHIGTLFQLLTLRKFLSKGLDVVILMGGGTTIVGDPSFTISSRPGFNTSNNLSENNSKFSYITQSQSPSFDHIINSRRDELIGTIGSIMTRPITINNNSIIPKMELFKEYKPDGFPKVWIVDNSSIHKNVSLSEYLEFVGNNFQLNRMLARDSIKKRLSCNDESSKEGMSFSELAYMTLQALDFVHLSQTYNVRIQIGGSDQWGNIVSGVDLAKSLGVGDLYGITTKLILDSSKNKLSKSNYGDESIKSDCTIWISPSTSALSVWQFFRNTQDDDVATFIKYFTDIPIREIDELVERDINSAKNRLSDDITSFMYGQESIDLINRFWAFNKDKSNEIFKTDLSKIEDSNFVKFLDYVPSIKVSRSKIVEGLGVVDALKMLVCDSNSSARTLIKQGTCYINNELCQINSVITEKDIKNIPYGDDYKSFVFIRIGKKQLYVIRVGD